MVNRKQKNIGHSVYKIDPKSTLLGLDYDKEYKFRYHYATYLMLYASAKNLNKSGKHGLFRVIMDNYEHAVLVTRSLQKKA